MGNKICKLSSVLILFIILFCISADSIKAQGQSMQVWTTDGLRRVKKSGRDLAIDQVSLLPYWGNSSVIKLQSAKNEYEAAQVVVTAGSQSLSGVNMSVSDLVNPQGTKILSSNVKLFREHYVNVTTSYGSPGWPNPPLGTGWFPDAAIPFKDPFDGSNPSGVTYDAVPFSVNAGENQPIWIEVYVPAGKAAGVYSGQVTVTASGQTPVNIPFEIQVWDFELPKSPSLKSIFLFGWHYPRSYDIRTRYYEEFLRHRLMPTRVQDSSKDFRYYYDNFGLNTIMIGPFSGVNVGSCNIDEGSIPSPSDFAAYEAQVPADLRPKLNMLNYSFDEVWGCPASFYQKVCLWGYNLHQGTDYLKHYSVVHPIPELMESPYEPGKSCMDGWGFMPLMFRNDWVPEQEMVNRINTVRARGNEINLGNVLIQDEYSPKWVMNFRLIEFRVFTWIAKHYDTTMIGTWRADFGGLDFWTNPDTMGPGEGALIYHGTESLTGFEGLVPSLRLKAMRDSADDFDYFTILKNLGGESYLTQQVNSVGPDWWNWTRDPSKLYQARQNIANKIIELSGGKPTSTPLPTTTGTITPTSSTGIPGDINKDGKVNQWDMKRIINDYSVVSAIIEDADSNGKVNILDTGLVYSNWTAN